MSLPFLRFRLRAALIAVAIVALLLGSFVFLKRRSLDFRRRATAHTAVAKFLSHNAWIDTKSPPLPWEDLEERDRVRRWHLDLVDYHDELAGKYSHAADRPWLPVAADPPVPSGNTGFKPGVEFSIFERRGIDRSVLDSMPVFGRYEGPIP